MMTKDPESQEFRKGYSIGSWAAGNPILRLIVYPFFRVYLHFASKPFKEFRTAYPASKLVAFIVYSEPHQHEYLFGDSGILRNRTWNVLRVDYRKELLNQWVDKQGWIIAKILDNLRITLKGLPFGVVFTQTGLPSVYHFSKPYRKRRRDGGAKIDDCLSRFVDEIDAHLDAQNHNQSLDTNGDSASAPSP